MPLAEFTDQMYAGLVKDSDQFAIGLGEDLFKECGWEYQRGQMYEAAQDYFKDALAPYLKELMSKESWMGASYATHKLPRSRGQSRRLMAAGL